MFPERAQSSTRRNSPTARAPSQPDPEPHPRPGTDTTADDSRPRVFVHRAPRSASIPPSTTPGRNGCCECTATPSSRSYRRPRNESRSGPSRTNAPPERISRETRRRFDRSKRPVPTARTSRHPGPRTPPHTSPRAKFSSRSTTEPPASPSAPPHPPLRQSLPPRQRQNLPRAAHSLDLTLRSPPSEAVAFPRTAFFCALLVLAFPSTRSAARRAPGSG